ncbi:acyltransferase family protein [Sphingomonas faeni]|uniref:acyltransferase family protein n=1 Tax=Sphingomonas faeni TaxID=185950 RepID=UPI0020C74E7E|nr:acyltransferase [Sphingomonas faeni]MCP8889317.1 acyltransferase [Sphingomonas faeni]
MIGRSLLARLRPREPELDRDQIAPLQLLRGIAASGVVIEHLLERYLRRGAIPDTLPEFTSLLGQVGVATFFAISGFIMVHISLRDGRRPPSGRAFLRNRYLRVAPLYYLMTLLIVLFGWLAHRIGAASDFRMPTAAEFLLSFAFIPHRGGNGLIQPIYGLGWTLHYEMFFYLLFAAGLALGARRGAYLVLLALCLLVIAGTRINAPPDTLSLPLAVYVFTRPIMGYFAVGIGIALIRHRFGDRLPTVPMSLIAAIALAALAGAALAPSDRMAMLATAVALAATVLLSPAPSKTSEAFSTFSRVFGNASYSMYLTHSFILGAFASATASIVARGTPALVAMALLACLLCFAIGWASWRLIERPIATLVNRRRPSRAELVAP